jgi:enamine deaminase RidA (YjgF/YER057c/UK114 family)
MLSLSYMQLKWADDLLGLAGQCGKVDQAGLALAKPCRLTHKLRPAKPARLEIHLYGMLSLSNMQLKWADDLLGLAGQCGKVDQAGLALAKPCGLTHTLCPAKPARLEIRLSGMLSLSNIQLKWVDDLLGLAGQCGKVDQAGLALAKPCRLTHTLCSAKPARLEIHLSGMLSLSNMQLKWADDLLGLAGQCGKVDQAGLALANLAG